MDLSRISLNVAGKYFTAADLTIGWVQNHAIQIHGEFNASFPLIPNVHFVDTNEQMLKVSYTAGNPTSSDNGVVEWCVFEYSAGVGPQWYIGGVDAHQAHNWIMRNNFFQKFAVRKLDWQNMRFTSGRDQVTLWWKRISSSTVIAGTSVG